MSSAQQLEQEYEMSEKEQPQPSTTPPLPDHEKKSAAEWITAASTAALAASQIYNTVRPPSNQPPEQAPPPQTPEIELPPGVDREQP